MIARYLTSPDPRARLIEDYIYELTGSSLQSAEEVQRTAGALGINDAELRKRISNLRTLFVARNEISHELDLQRPEQPGDRTRRSRRIEGTKALCQEGLEVAQLILNGAGNLVHAWGVQHWDTARAPAPSGRSRALGRFGLGFRGASAVVGDHRGDQLTVREDGRRRGERTPRTRQSVIPTTTGPAAAAWRASTNSGCGTISIGTGL
jgi:hypothetical protein